MTWVRYETARPPKGLVRWKCSHMYIPGLEVEFGAEMQIRWAGHRSELAPEFAHWDGYAHRTPDGLSWNKLVAERGVYVGVQFSPCRACGKQPNLTGAERAISASGSQRLCLWRPHRWTEWSIKPCCQWVGAPWFENPIDLVKRWNMIHGHTPVEVGQ